VPGGSSNVIIEEQFDTNTWNGEARMRRHSPAGYDLYRYLGGGGMGDVYLAREHIGERTVAMKFLRGSPHSASAERFVAEIRALGRLDHPNIVRVITYDLDRADPHFTMEYVPGGTLGDRVKSKGPMPAAEAARILATVARAVHTAHGENIIHRDLKPSNIVLTADGNPKITDFGLAKRTDSDQGLTISSSPLGTPAYMPPEQISSRHGSIGLVSDVYGLGATLYHVVTGRPPFEGDHDVVLSRVVSEPPPRPCLLRPQLPRELEAVILKCLEKDPRRRYASCHDLADDLDRFLAGQRPIAPQMTRLRRARQWVGRYRQQIAVATLALIAVTAIAALLWNRPHGLDPAVKSAPDETVARDQLIAGKKVMLVGATDYPKWLGENWIVNSSGLSTSPAADGALNFESIQTTMLALLKDPGVERYQVTVEMKVLASKLDPDNVPVSPNQLPQVGFFFGDSRVVAEDQSEAHAYFCVRFRDYLPPKLAGLDAGSAQLGCDCLINARERKTVSESSLASASKTLRFKPSLTLPGNWKTIRAQIQPGSIKTFWKNETKDEWQLLSELNESQIAASMASQQAWITTHRPDLKVMLPAWSPRSAFGIWNQSSAVALRNVVVEPLP